jgi:hypothetical protein
VVLYGKRFTIEETLRDAKDIRFGMGLSARTYETPDGATASRSIGGRRQTRAPSSIS